MLRAPAGYCREDYAGKIADLVRESIAASRRGLDGRGMFSLGLSPDADAQQLLAFPDLREEGALRVACRLARRRDEGVLLSLHLSDRGRAHWHGLAITRLSMAEIVEVCTDAGLRRQGIYVKRVESQSNPGGRRFRDQLRHVLRYHLRLPRREPPGFDARPIATGRLRGILKRAIVLAGGQPARNPRTPREASTRSPTDIRTCSWCRASLLLLREDATRCPSCRRRAHREKREWALGFAVTIVLKFPGLRAPQIAQTITDMLPEAVDDIAVPTLRRWLDVLIEEGSLVLDEASGGHFAGPGHRAARGWRWDGHA